MEEEVYTLVIDNGTEMMKAGFAGDDAPRSVFPNVVRRPKYQGVMVGMAQKDAYVGDEASTRNNYRNLRTCRPMVKGVITSFDDMEKIWHHTFYNELRVQPDEHTVLLTERIFNPKPTREKMTEIMFETFGLPSMYLAKSAALSLYETGRLNGIVIDSGSTTDIVPIYEGYALKDYSRSMELSGDDLTTYAMKVLNERGYSFTTTAEKEIVRDIKEKKCYIAMDYSKELKEMAMHCSPIGSTFQYELPDGQIIHITEEKFKIPEILFQPDLFGKTFDGIHKCLYQSMLKCPMHYTELCSDIVLSGGNSLFPGIEKRLTKEITALLTVNDNYLFSGYLRNNYSSVFNIPLSKDISGLIYKLRSMLKVKVIAVPERKYIQWIGGSIFGSLSSFDELCITKIEYKEFGKQIVNRKCF